MATFYIMMVTKACCKVQRLDSNTSIFAKRRPLQTFATHQVESPATGPDGVRVKKQSPE